jgi:hypothetical protein
VKRSTRYLVPFTPIELVPVKPVRASEVMTNS